METQISGHIDQPYQPNQPYNVSAAYHMPPTILEPAEYDADNGALRLDIKPFRLPTQEYGNPMFLQQLASLPMQTVSFGTRKYDWEYTLRHKAQPILPFLFLGPLPVVRDSKFIDENGITMVIAVRSAQAARQSPRLLDPARFPSCHLLETATFDVDSPYEIITRVRPILKLMNDHLEARTNKQALRSLNDVGGRIFVFCESGNERSPVLVASYLMLLYGLGWQAALNLIHAHRFSICLSSSMNDMLKTWEGILQAESDTAVALAPPVGNVHDPRNMRQRIVKRNIDDAYGSDDEMEDVGNVEIRAGIAPFKDSLV